MDVARRRLRRFLHSLGAKLARVPVIVLIAGLGAPTALAMSALVAIQVDAGRDVQRVIALPVAEARVTWAEEIEAFSVRLEDGFGLRAEQADVFAGWILEASTRQAVSPELLASLIYTESTFRTRARSWSGAVGPAQVKPRFWTHFCGGADLADPEHNIYCGAQILAHYAEQCGDFECAFRLYNVGPSNLRDPYYEERSDVYLVKIESGRARLEGAPAAAAL